MLARLLSLVLVAAWSLVGTQQSSYAQGTPAATSPATALRPTVLEDRLEFVKPAPRSDEEVDRLEAIAIFAAARKKQENQPDEALRLCQRAYRRDPGRGAILLEIMILARSLNRISVIDNYAAAALASNPKNPALLALLSDRFNKHGEFSSSADALERLLALERESDKKTAAHVERVMITGRVHVAAGNFVLAADRFAELLRCLDKPRDYGLSERDKREIVGEAGPTYLIMGEAFLRAGRLKEAEEAFQTAFRVSRDKPGEAFQMARIHAEAARYDEARKQLQIYFDDGGEGNGVAPYELLVETYTKQKRPEVGVAELEKLHKTKQAADQADPFLTYVLAEQYRKAGRQKEAATLLDDVVKQAGDKQKLRAAAVAAQLTRFKMALEAKNAEALLSVLGWVAGEVGSLTALGEEYEKLSKDKPLVAAIVKLVQTRKTDLDYGYRLAGGLVATEAKDYAAAGELFEAAIDADPKKADDIVRTWGLSLLRADKNAEAVKVFQRGLDDRLAPAEDPALMHHWLAFALELTGKTDDALRIAKEGAKLAPTDAQAQFRVPWVHYHAKEYDAAQAEYLRLIKQFESNAKLRETSAVRSQLRQARLSLSNIAVVRRDLPGAEEWLEQVLDEDPGDTSAQNDLGYLWADQNKRLNRAYAMIRNALEADPSNAAYLDSLGWILFRLGETDAAVAELEKAVKADEKPDATILDHLGDVYAAAKQPAKARVAYDRALKGFDAKNDADKIKATQEKLDKLPK